MNDNHIFAYEYLNSEQDCKTLTSFIVSADDGMYELTYVRTSVVVDEPYSYHVKKVNRYRLESIKCVQPPLRGIKNFTESRRLREPNIIDEIKVREREWVE